jgi:hypothetical protein
MTVGLTCPTRPEISNGRTRLRRARGCFASVLVACFAAIFSMAAQTAATNANRFLFIIDTSASMKPFDKALHETVFDLVYSGVRGQMTQGDTYGIWLVNDQTDTSFSMESWGQRHSVELGGKAAAHVKKQGYNNKARLDIAFADVMRVVRNVGDLTIILVSNGETPIAGTPFDGAVNDRFRQLVPEMKRAKATLNTAFVARDGEIVAWAVNTPELLVSVPYVPLKPKPVVTESVASNANAPSEIPPSNSISKALVSSPVAPTNMETRKPRTSPKPIIITKETVAEEKRTYQSLTMTGNTNEPAPMPAATNSVAKNSSVPATNVAGVSPTTDPKPVAAVTNGVLQSPNLANLPANRPATNAILAQTKVDSINSAFPVDSTTIIAGAEPPPAARGFHPILWAGIGAGITLIVVLTIALTCRSRRQEPSLISQTIGLESIQSRKI